VKPIQYNVGDNLDEQPAPTNVSFSAFFALVRATDRGRAIE
jgi:hypothetical protein